MDNKCRICLGNKKNVRSIFDSPSQDDCSFALMITSLTKIKIETTDGFPNKICLPCRKKLKEAYDFKILIVRSDAALQSTAGSKKIIFDNFNDIKIQIDIKIPKLENNIDEYFKDRGTSVCYNDTIIKKVEPCDIDIKNENGPLSVLDFLNSIKDDDANDFNNDYDVDYEPISDAADEEYFVPLSKRLKQKKTKKKEGIYTAKTAIKSKFTPVCIKPVYLSDIKVLPTRDYDKPKIKKKYHTKPKPKSMCNICGRMVHDIKKHILAHTGERSFKCEKCGKGYLTAKDLYYHQSKAHVTEKKFKCDKCIAAFTNKGALTSHMNRHADQNRFKCDVCNKGFKRKRTLLRHKLMHNIANKCIKCDLCNMSFFTKAGLNHHLRIHTGERPYNCEICSQPYSYKHDFNRHCFKKHGVFLKRRSVKVMNEDVLKKEREIMRDLMLKIHGFTKEGETLEPFDGPQGYLALEQAVSALQAKQIPIDFNI